MRHALAGLFIVTTLALGASWTLVFESAASTVAQGLEISGTTALTSMPVGLDGSNPQFTYPYSPFCPHGPEATDCFLSGS